MSRPEQGPGLLGLLLGERWQSAAWRALLVFVAAYVLPTMLLGSASRLAGFSRALATVLAFGLTAAAVYKFLQLQSEQDWASDEDEGEGDESAATPASPIVPAASSEASAEPVLQLESLGQAALERVCIALYQFNGLNSQTVATGVDGGYRIRLVPRNTEKPFAILQCHAGLEVQDTPAYTALLRVMQDEVLEKAFFVAPGGFTPAVSADARSRHVTLVDLKLLQAMIDRLPDASMRTAVFAAAA